MPVKDYPANVKLYKDGLARNVNNSASGDAGQAKDHSLIDRFLANGWSITDPRRVPAAEAPKGAPLAGVTGAGNLDARPAPKK